jgi:hypothetical protein
VTKPTQGLLIVLILATAPAAAQKTTIEYASGLDLAGIETFWFVSTTESNAPDQLVHDRLKHALLRELYEAGLKSSRTDPDIHVTYHLVAPGDPTYRPEDFGYGGFHAGWRSWRAGGRTSPASTLDPSKTLLIIDAWDPLDTKLIWHGSGTVSPTQSSDKQLKQIDKIVAKLGKRWAKILDGKRK